MRSHFPATLRIRVPLPVQVLALWTLAQRSIPDTHHAATVLRGGLSHCRLPAHRAKGLCEVEFQHRNPDFESRGRRHGIRIAAPSRHLQVVQREVGLGRVGALGERRCDGILIRMELFMKLISSRPSTTRTRTERGRGRRRSRRRIHPPGSDTNKWYSVVQSAEDSPECRDRCHVSRTRITFYSPHNSSFLCPRI